MSNAYKAASSLGAATLVLSGAAMAAAPTAFDQWTVTGGDITSACPATFTCTTAVTGDGFFQRQITDTATGNDFFQTIITDSGVTGSPGGLSFSDESFVQTGNVGGLADKSSINDTATSGTLTEVFSAETTLLTGWASTNGTDDEVKIYQGISADDVAADAEDFRTDFWLDQVGAEGAVGKLMRITSAVDIQEASGTVPAQVQDFVLVDRSGTAKVETAVDGGVDIDGDATDDLTWNTGDRIKAIWVGQNMSDIVGVGQEFGFTSYSEIVSATTTVTVSDFSLAASSSSAPIDWNTAVAPNGWGSLATDGSGGPF